MPRQRNENPSRRMPSQNEVMNRSPDVITEGGAEFIGYHRDALITEEMIRLLNVLNVTEWSHFVEILPIANTHAGFFSPAPLTAGSTLPLPGANAQTLSEIAGFDDTNIPDEFRCSISNEIMDNPVYDPDHPQYKFERKWIEQWLTNGKNENPYTRTPLAVNQLMSDDGLRKRIQDFISLERKHASNEKFCGMKPGFLK